MSAASRECSRIVAHLEAVKSLLGPLTGQKHSFCSAAQRSVCTKDFALLKTGGLQSSASLIGQVMSAVKAAGFTLEDEAALVDLLADKSTSAADGGSSERKYQDWTSMLNFLTESVHRSFQGPNKVLAFFGFLAEAGLQVPSEPTSQMMAIITMLCCEGVAVATAKTLQEKSFQVKITKRWYKGFLSQKSSKPTVWVWDLPQCPEDLRLQHPELYAKMYKDEPPIACPIDPMIMEMMLGATRMRGPKGWQQQNMPPQNLGMQMQNLGMQNHALQNLGVQNLGAQNLGMQNLGMQNPGMQNGVVTWPELQNVLGQILAAVKENHGAPRAGGLQLSFPGGQGERRAAIVDKDPYDMAALDTFSASDAPSKKMKKKKKKKKKSVMETLDIIRQAEVESKKDKKNNGKKKKKETVEAEVEATKEKKNSNKKKKKKKKARTEIVEATVEATKKKTKKKATSGTMTGKKRKAAASSSVPQKPPEIKHEATRTQYVAKTNTGGANTARCVKYGHGMTAEAAKKAAATWLRKRCRELGVEATCLH